MQSLMMLHRNLMQKNAADDAAERDRQLKEQKAYPERAEERKSLRNFLKERALDQRARRARQPRLRVVEDCGSELGE